MKTYPLKFRPILKEKIWGGTKLTQTLGKESSSHNIGESWEISGVEGNISEVANGSYAGTSLQFLQNTYGKEFLGAANFARFGNDFPLLIKFLDAKENLSVQVHPDDTMAKENHNSFGKTEMWYIMDHEPGAEIIVGMNEAVDDLNVLKHVNRDNVESIFNFENVEKGDSFFIPAGKVHAIGAGVVLAEIQQTSDITYRVYDWDRIDRKGLARDLHIEQSIEATKPELKNTKSEYDLSPNKTENLVNCEFFKTNILELKYSYFKDYGNLDSFVIYLCVEGHAEVMTNGHRESIKMGETILLPANTQEVFLTGTSAKILEVYIDSQDLNHFKKAS